MGKYSKRLTDHQKRKLLEEFHSSNYSISAFCRINGIKRSTFEYWKENPSLNRGIVGKTTVQSNQSEDIQEDEPQAISSLVKVGGANSDDEKGIIDIPAEVLMPHSQVCKNNTIIKDTSKITSPIRLSLGRIRIELDEGCSAMEFKNIITVLNGVI